MRKNWFGKQMKKTQFIELFKNINKTKVTFLSIAFFAMLSTMAYLGIEWSSSAYSNSVNNVLNNHNNHDIEIRYPYGLDDKFVQDLEKQDYVEAAEGEYSNYQYFSFNDSPFQAKVVSLSNKINVLNVVEGNLPTSNKECAIEEIFATKHGIKVGDVIKFDHDDDGTAYQLNAIINNDLEALEEGERKSSDGMAYLTNDKYVVTALVDSVEHLGKYESHLGNSDKGTPVNVLIYLTKDAFDLNTVTGYTRVIVTNDSLKQYSADNDDYTKYNEELIKKIEDFSKDYIDKRNNQIIKNRDSISNQILEAITEGEKMVAEGKDKISDGEIAIANGKIDLENAKKTLEDSQEEVDKGWETYNASLAEYNESKKELTILQKVCDVTEIAIDIFNFVDDSRGEFYQKMADLKTYWDLVSTIAGINLPNSYYAVEKLQDFFNDVNNNKDVYYEKAGEFVDQYNKFVEEIKQDPNFPSLEVVNQELDNAIENATSEADKENIAKLKEKINEFYSEFELYAKLPSELLDLFGDIKDDTELLTFTETIIVMKVNSKLSELGVPTLKTILNKIDEIVDAKYNDFEDIKSLVTDVFNYLRPYIDALDKAVEETFKPKLNEAWAKLNSAKYELDNGYNKLRSSETEIANGWNKYNDGLLTIAKNEKDLADAKVELEKGEKDLANSKQLYEKYLDSTSGIKAYDAAITGRQSSYSIVAVKMGKNVIVNLRNTMAALFVIVGVFVSYTSMSRLVHDQTVTIGTKKALGFKQSEITASFLLYAAFATIFGLLFGFVFARYIIEPIVVSVVTDSFTIHDILYYVGVRNSIIFALFEIAITVLAAYLACRNILKRKATQLLVGSEEVLGKQRFYEKSFIWKKLSLLNKTIINNCFNDTRRVFGTIVGIAGCSALLVCAISFKNNIDYSISRQINDLVNFDTVVDIDKEVDKAETNITKELDKLNIEYTGAYVMSGFLKEENSYCGATIYVAESDELYDYYPQMDGNKYYKATDGVIVSKSFCKWNNFEIGDEITFIDSTGREHTFALEAVVEDYLLNVDMRISAATYEKEFGGSIKNNILLVRRNDISLDELTETLNKCDGFMSISDYEASVKEGLRAVTSIAYIIFAIFLILSVLLALLVILNLLVMFVDEKKKEVIVLMINGYKKKFAKKYIYTDTIFLIVIGVIIGSIFGSIVGVFTTKSLNSSAALFMTKFLPKTYLLATFITLILCAICSTIALRKIDKYKLTDINASK